MDGFELNTTHYKPRKGRAAGIVLGVLVLVVATAAGVWFWRQRDIDTLKARLQNPSPPQVHTEDTLSPDNISPSEWNQITLGPTPLSNNKLAGFSFKLPPTWTMLNCGFNEILIAFIAPNTQSQAICGTEQISPIIISVQPGDTRKNHRYNDKAIYKGFKSEEAIINDKEFELNTALVEQPGEFGLPAGSTITSYVLFDEAQSATYVATYVKTKDAAIDLSSNFKQMVEKTFTIVKSQ